MISTPVLFLIFNRPSTTTQVFQAIREAKPSRLFIAADGPRPSKPGEAELCAQTRAIIKQVDWPCEVVTLFRDENLGCKNAIKGALDWFFTHVEEGIILEDDCKPDQSFFPFCQQMLQRYRNVEEIGVISGTNYLFGSHDHLNSYYFSPFQPIWGWATWRRFWQKIDFSIPYFDRSVFDRNMCELFPNKKFRKALNLMIEPTIQGTLDSWDLYHTIYGIHHKTLSVTPYRNLVCNLGVESSRTDDIQSDSGELSAINMPVLALDIPSLQHPTKIGIDRMALKRTMKIVGDITFKPLVYRIKSKVKKLIRGSTPQ